MPLLFQVLIAVVGLGVPKALLDHYCGVRLSEVSRWATSIVVLVVLVVAGQRYVDLMKQPRHLSIGDYNRLAVAFKDSKANFSQFQIAAPIGDGEAAGYATDFVNAFNRMGMKAVGPGILEPMNASTTGLQVGVRDLSRVPPIANEFAKCLADAQFKVVGTALGSVDANGFMFIVGARPQ